MRARAFMNAVANGQRDVVQLLLDVLDETKSDYCVIGGLAVNAYAEPVVSLDLDLVAVADHIERICAAAAAKGFQVERFEHRINLSASGSDVRIQLQIDPRYQGFLARAVSRSVLGYEMMVASLEDVLAGKLWANADPTRRKSKRQKDLADILRLVETHPQLKDRIPADLLPELE